MKLFDRGVNGFGRFVRQNTANRFGAPRKSEPRGKRSGRKHNSPGGLGIGF